MSGNATSSSAQQSYYSAAASVFAVGIALDSAGLMLNSFVLAALVNARVSTPALRLGLASLCVADFFVSLSTLAINGLHYHWITTTDLNEGRPHTADPGIYRSEYCAMQVANWLWYTAANANQLTLLGLAALQFVSTRWPLHSQRWLSTGRSWIALSAAWLFSATIGFLDAVIVAVVVKHPNVNLWPTKGTSRFCYQLVMYNTMAEGGRYKYDFGKKEMEEAWMILGLGILCTVLIGLFGSYGYVIMVVRRRNQSFTTTANIRQCDQRRVVLVTLMVTFLCLGSYLPLFTCNILEKRGHADCLEPQIYAALVAIGSVAPIADPLVYMLRLKAIRRGARALVAGCSTCQTIGNQSKRPEAAKAAIGLLDKCQADAVGSGGRRTNKDQ